MTENESLIISFINMTSQQPREGRKSKQFIINRGIKAPLNKFLSLDLVRNSLDLRNTTGNNVCCLIPLDLDSSFGSSMSVNDKCIEIYEVDPRKSRLNALYGFDDLIEPPINPGSIYIEVVNSERRVRTLSFLFREESITTLRSLVGHHSSDLNPESVKPEKFTAAILLDPRVNLAHGTIYLQDNPIVLGIKQLNLPLLVVLGIESADLSQFIQLIDRKRNA